MVEWWAAGLRENPAHWPKPVAAWWWPAFGVCSEYFLSCSLGEDGVDCKCLEYLQEFSFPPIQLYWDVTDVCVLSHFNRVWLFVTLWSVACQAPLSMGILQARILEWVVMPSSKGSSLLRDWTCVSCSFFMGGGFFTTEPLGKPIYLLYIPIYLIANIPIYFTDINI